MFEKYLFLILISIKDLQWLRKSSQLNWLSEIWPNDEIVGLPSFLCIYLVWHKVTKNGYPVWAKLFWERILLRILSRLVPYLFSEWYWYNIHQSILIVSFILKSCSFFSSIVILYSLSFPTFVSPFCPTLSFFYYSIMKFMALCHRFQ